MKNKVLNFDSFKKGSPVQDPKKEALVSGGDDSPKKEKFIDQLKHASLSRALKTNEPDYSKVNEEAASEISNLNNQITGLQNQVNLKNQELQKLNAELARITAERDKKQSEATAAAASAATKPATQTPSTPAPATPAAPAPATPAAAATPGAQTPIR